MMLSAVFFEKPWLWLIAHPIVPVFLALVGLVSMAKIPPPKNPRYRWIWVLLVRVAFAAWDEWGMQKLKVPGTLVPRPPWEENPNWPDPPTVVVTGATPVPTVVVMPPERETVPPPTPRDGRQA